MDMIKIEIDKSKLRALTHDQLRKQSSYAIAKTLTGAAYEVRKRTQQNIPKWLDTRTQYLQRAIAVDGATVRNQTARVGFLERANLVSLFEEGGTRHPKRRAIAVPTAHVGKITRGKTPSNILRRKNVFISTINGTHGIYQMTNRRVRLLYTFKEQTKYEKKHMKFHKTAEAVAPKFIEKNLWKNLVHAINTAKI